MLDAVLISIIWLFIGVIVFLHFSWRDKVTDYKPIELVLAVLVWPILCVIAVLLYMFLVGVEMMSAKKEKPE